jgi:hypothetical protein
MYILGLRCIKCAIPPSPYGLMRVSARGCDDRVMCGVGVLVGKCVSACVSLRLLQVSMSACASAQAPVSFPFALLCNSLTLCVAMCMH